MRKIVLSIILTLMIIYPVPFLLYSVFSTVIDFKPPENLTPLQFLGGIFISKVGTAIAFVMIFFVARNSLSGRWLSYAFIWWIMFVIGEVGQAIEPNYTGEEAIAGIISETIYFPLSASVVNRLIKP